MKPGRKGKGLLFGTLAFLCVSGILLAALLWNGVILLNRPSEAQYPVRGVDVSAYQGSIDWAVLASQGISFAFLKATEGSSMTDRCFAYNYEQAREQGLRVGAYHFFSFDSPGRTQAEVREQLDCMLDLLEAYYGVKPILYATARSYERYLAGAYNDYDIWFRSVYTAPRLSDGREWTFWQYTNRARLEGYDGEERFIDLNVFCGAKEAFEQYANGQKDN